MRRVRESSVAASLVVDVIGYLERAGVPSADLFNSLQINAAKLKQPQSRMPGSLMERLWEVGGRFTGDPNLGLHTAEAHNPSALSVVGYLLWSCSTCGEALDRLARYAAFLNDGLRVGITVDGERTSCQFDAVENLDNYLTRSPRQVMEAMAAGVIVTLRRLTTSRVEPLAVSFQHPAPADVDEHARVLGPAVLFSEPANRVEYRTSDLGARLLSADATLLPLLESQAENLLASLDPHGPVTRQVSTLLTGELRGNTPPLDRVAAKLAMSTRTLQRELRAEGTTYRQLAETVKRELALQHLALPNVSVTEVAFVLGFSEPSAFTRAFRRWTGTSPRSFRST